MGYHVYLRHGILVHWHIKTRIESVPVTTDLKTSVIHSSKLLINDIKPDHSLNPGGVGYHVYLQQGISVCFQIKTWLLLEVSSRSMQAERNYSSDTISRHLATVTFTMSFLDQGQEWCEVWSRYMQTARLLRHLPHCDLDLVGNELDVHQVLHLIKMNATTKFHEVVMSHNKVLAICLPTDKVMPTYPLCAVGDTHFFF